jgi:hypothetical protein
MRYEITFGFAISGDLPFRLSTPIYLRDRLWDIAMSECFRTVAAFQPPR